MKSTEEMVGKCFSYKQGHRFIISKDASLLVFCPKLVAKSSRRFVRMEQREKRKKLRQRKEVR